MKYMGIVHGNTPQAKPIVIGKDTVYIHTDIQPVIEDGEIVENLFSYHEVQCSYQEYLQMFNDETNTALADTDAFNVDQELRITLLELGGV